MDDRTEEKDARRAEGESAGWEATKEEYASGFWARQRARQTSRVASREGRVENEYWGRKEGSRAKQGGVRWAGRTGAEDAAEGGGCSPCGHRP